MTKAERAKRIREMLTALGEEQVHSMGFNEFPQFCEETLSNMAYHLTERGQRLLIENIERTSSLGVTRRSPKVKSKGSARFHA